jgi:hypothetical protein
MIRTSSIPIRLVSILFRPRVAAVQLRRLQLIPMRSVYYFISISSLGAERKNSRFHALGAPINWRRNVRRAGVLRVVKPETLTNYGVVFFPDCSRRDVVQRARRQVQVRRQQKVRARAMEVRRQPRLRGWIGRAARLQ